MTLEANEKAFIDALTAHLRNITTMLNGSAQGGDLTNLDTTVKTNLVAAINELHTGLANIDMTSIISDTTSSATDKTYSIDKIKSHVTDQLDALVAGAPGALDTLNELASALTSNDSDIAGIVTALSKRVSVEAQTLTTGEKDQARTNINAASPENIDAKILAFSGPAYNMATYFTTGINAV